MKISILGAGSVGSTLGRSWGSKKVMRSFFGVRNPEDDKTQRLLKEIGTKAQAGTVAEAIAFSDVIPSSTSLASSKDNNY